MTAADPPTPAPGAVPSGAVRLSAALWVVMVAMIAMLQALISSSPLVWTNLAAVVALMVLSYVESVHLVYGAERHRMGFSFNEVGVAVALVFLAGAAVPVAILLGNAIYHLVIRHHPVKTLYNTAQDTISAGVAVLLLTALPPFGPAAAGVPLLPVAIATLGFALSTVLIRALLLRTLIGPGGWREPLSTLEIDTIASVGSISVGVLGIHLWLTDPLLLTFAAVPLAAVALAYRATLTSYDLERQRAADQRGLGRLVASASDGIVLVDAQSVIRVWNPVLASATGIPSDDAEGRPLAALMDGVERLADAPLGTRAETVATWGGGRVLEEHTSTLYDSDAKQTEGKVIVLRDITSKHEADALKSDFVARVSHELRTPLTPLIGFVELLRARGDRFTPGIHATALDSMTRNARRLSALVDELLLVVELDGGLQQRTAVVDLALTTEAAIGRLRLDATGHAIDVDIPHGTLAAGEAEHLTELLVHLLDNAIRYSPAGSRVEIMTASEDHMIVLRVSDQGPGIPPAAHELVFERFSRLEGPLRMRTGGLGLGLFIARRLAASMGGTLGIGSSTADGTTMELRLPAVLTVDARSGPEAETSRSGESEEAGERQAAAGRRQDTA